jgi:hypothetical protein
LTRHLPVEYAVYAEGRVESEQETRIPDIVIVKKEKVKEVGQEVLVERGGVVAVVETKRSQKNAHEGLTQAISYATIQLKCKLGFATNYFEVISFILGENPRVGKKESFGTEQTPQTVDAIARYVASIVTGEASIALSTEESLEVLRAVIMEIADIIREIDTGKLKTPLGLMDELIWKEEEENLEEVDAAIRKAAVYLVVNQILFYNALSNQIPTLRQLRSIRTMSELQEYLSEAYQIDYEPVFLPRVAEKLPNRAVDGVNRVIDVITELQIDRYKHDVLGPLFHELIPYTIRKRLGAYYTENASADLLARLAVQREEDRVLDLSCGSGTLLVSCYNVKKEHAPEEKLKAIGALHRKLLNEIYGCDITYFAAHLAVINMALREPLAETRKVLS